MKVSDYVPDLYKNNIEMTNIINSKEQEFENYIKLDIDNGFDDNFIKTATEKGIERYENMLDIPVNKNLDTEDRRNQVIIELLATPPYTYNRLLEILDMYCGQNNYEIYQNINKYTMKIITHFSNNKSATSLFKTLKKIFPANIDLGLTNTNNVDLEGYVKLVNYITTLETINIISEKKSNTFKIKGKILSENIYGKHKGYIEIYSSNSTEILQSVDTNGDGTFEVILNKNTYNDVYICKDGYLYYCIENVYEENLDEIDIGELKLVAGDFNDNGTINTRDTSLINKQLNQPVTEENEIYDLNGDGLIDDADLEIYNAHSINEAPVITYTELKEKLGIN